MANVPDIVSGAKQTRIMVAVNQSSTTGYPNKSASTTRAFRWALDKIARSNPACFHLIIIHVLPLDAPRSMERSAGEFMSDIVAECNGLLISTDPRIRNGDPAKVICDEVKKAKPELLVLGRRGLGAFNSLFLRNVSEHCMNNAECPVVAIKRRPEDIQANYGAADD